VIGSQCVKFDGTICSYQFSMCFQEVKEGSAQERKRREKLTPVNDKYQTYKESWVKIMKVVFLYLRKSLGGVHKVKGERKCLGSLEVKSGKMRGGFRRLLHRRVYTRTHSRYTIYYLYVAAVG